LRGQLALPIIFIQQWEEEEKIEKDDKENRNIKSF
jgi:hypothetical protein